MALTDPLPEDIETLRGLLRSVAAERDTVLAERDLLAEQNDRLRHLLRQLQRMQFGRRSEKLRSRPAAARPRRYRAGGRARHGRGGEARAVRHSTKCPPAPRDPAFAAA